MSEQEAISLHPERATGSDRTLLDRAFEPGQIYAVYQPIVRLDDWRVVAHEGLMRMRDQACSPLELLAMARSRGRLGELEALAARVVAQGYNYLEADVHLTINLSAQAILQNSVRPDDILKSLGAAGVDLARFVVEITEHDIVDDSMRLAEALGFLRAAGVRVALDDFGNGHSNFEMWHQISPEFVKVDAYLVAGIAHNAGKLAIVKALQSVAATLGADLIAEGVEHQSDLMVVRDLGIRFGQGFLLGRPNTHPERRVPIGLDVKLGAKIPVHPQARRSADNRRLTAAHFQVNAPTVAPTASNDEVADLFMHHSNLHALPVIEGGRPIGLINRRVFTENYATPFVRELHGRKSCTVFMHASPVMCEINQSIDSMIDILRGEDQRYLSDGFVITENGIYRGLGTGESLVRRVTELRIEAARYANPLTFFPGNIPVTEHIDRLLESSRAFAAAYLDLNHFKPFNDQYGYFRGDKMILLLADAVGRHTDPTIDFAGHIGGDDFIVLFQSDDWERRCRSIIDEFNHAARSLFDVEDIRRDGLHSEDRQGNKTFFPLSTLSIGVAIVRPGRLVDAEEVASRAAAAKRRAKREASGLCVDWPDESQDD